jgi:hypothetical protein
VISAKAVVVTTMHCIGRNKMVLRAEEVSRKEPEVSLPRRKQSGNISEFALSLWVLMILFVCPLINLFGVSLAAAGVLIMDIQCASSAASAPTYAQALSAVTTQSNQLQSYGISRFMNLQPVGGYKNCGVDLYVHASNYRNGPNADFGPNKAPSGPVDPETYVYEYSTKASYLVTPWVNLSKVPMIGNIAGLGKPVQLTFNASRAIEDIEGLTAGSGTAVHAGFAKPPSITNTLTTSLVPEPAAGADWNYPNIYQLIEATGETVVETNVFQVNCNNTYYTNSGVSVSAGDKVWIDMTATGVWNLWPEHGMPNCAANGYSYSVAGKFPGGCMLGDFSGTPPVFLGSKQWNMVPNGAGPLYMGALDQQGPGPFPGLIEDSGWAWGPSLPGQPVDWQGSNGYGDNTGSMTVRVIIAQ